MTLGKWEYDSAYKWWTFSKGTGKFAVQRGQNGKWYVMKVPYTGPLEVIAPYESKKEAMKAVEEKFA